jgi:two-component system, cell cycle sensor histidine kinase and response regulator CckA
MQVPTPQQPSVAGADHTGGRGPEQPGEVLDRLPGMAYRGAFAPERPLWMASAGAGEVTGYTAEQLMDAGRMGFAGCIHPEDRQGVWSAVADCVGARRPFHLIYRIQTPQGGVRWVMDQGRGVFWADGEVAGLEGFIMDVTAQRAREADLRQAYKMDAVARLAGDVAEEFNSVLTTIKGYASLVSMGLSESDPLREDLREIEAAVDRATSRTRHLLDFGKHPLVLAEVVDVNEIAQAMEETLRHVVGEEVQLALSLASRLGRVSVHPSQVEQVLLNLVVNARDACSPGACITVETVDAEVAPQDAALTEAGPHVALTVRDTGCGMDESTVERVFEPFFTTHPEQGAGIGLSVVYRIARQHGGTVHVDSTPGQGTSVRVLLPRAAEAAPASADPGQAATPPRWQGTVLLVDDDPSIRHYVRRVLEQCGLGVLEAGSGEEGLRRAAAHSGAITLVVTDIVMPQMSGREFVRRLSAGRPGTPVLFLSGYFADAPRGDAFLTKPFSPQGLWEKLRLVLGAPAA